MTIYRVDDDPEGVAPNWGAREDDVPDEERIELTDPEGATGDERISRDGRNPTQRRLDAEPDSEHEVAPQVSDREGDEHEQEPRRG